MKHTNKLVAMLLLTLALVACSSMAVQTVEVTRVVPQTVVVTEAVPEGGFTTGTPVDVATLPDLYGVGDDGGYEPCFVESTEPSISWGHGYPGKSLCLNNFPTAPDSPGFTVTLTDPAGRTFSETFTYNQEDILDSRGTDVGSIEDGSGMEGYPATPGVIINIYMPASFTCGDWSVSANTQDGSINVGPTTLPGDCIVPRISVVSSLDINPFNPFEDSSDEQNANGKTVYVVGAAYPPNTAITVVLYQEDLFAGTPEASFAYMTCTAKYATSVMTDNAGSFQAPFLIGSGTPSGLYYAIAAPVITTETYIPYFGARLTVKQ